MPVELTEIRRSQIVTTYGPGAIIDVRAGGHGGTAISVIVGGLDEWDRSAAQTGVGLNHPQTIGEPRLQKILNVQGFRLPPVVLKDEDGRYDNGERLPCVRFPTWLHCPKCRVLKRANKWLDKPGDPARYCPDCSHGQPQPVHVIPVRFISCCEKGHIDEFPWNWWVAHKPGCKNQERLELQLAGAGLQGLILHCPGCGESRSMDGCFSKDSFKDLPCSGNRPWLGDRQSGCTATPRAVLRGASNIYFSALASALDIPPWSDHLQQSLGLLDWNRLASAQTDAKRLAIIQANDLAERVDVSEEQLLQAVKHRLSLLETQSEGTLRFDEYQALLGALHNDQVEFEVRSESVPPEFRRYFGNLLRVTRLREVRAIRSFTRLKPPADWRATGSENFESLSLERKDWLPAIEIRGEGVFLGFNSETLNIWEKKLLNEPFWADRLSRLNRDYAKEFQQRHGDTDTVPRTITLKFLLIHSFAHALMRQLALGSGYSTASLRERLYSDSAPNEMAGLLIYTASPDSDGTLGGLARQAAPDCMLATVAAAIRGIAWCSSDPLCIDGVLSRTEPLNPAACHSCLLAPEISCEEYNRLLDRALLVGTPDRRTDGFFSTLLSGD